MFSQEPTSQILLTRTASVYRLWNQVTIPSSRKINSGLSLLPPAALCQMMYLRTDCHTCLYDCTVVENADWQEHVNPNIVKTENASFLEAGYCESGTNLAQKWMMPTSFSFVFKKSRTCKSTVSSCGNNWYIFGKVDAATAVHSLVTM